jgi:hypothetical protein
MPGGVYLTVGTYAKVIGGGPTATVGEGFLEEHFIFTSTDLVLAQEAHGAE